MKYSQNRSAQGKKVRIRGTAIRNQSFNQANTPFFFAVIFLFLGVVLLLVSLKVLDIVDYLSGNHLVIIASVGALLCFLSAIFFKQAMDTQRKTKIQSLAMDPVAQDAPWDHKQYQPDTWTRFWKELGDCIFLTIFLIPMTWFLFQAEPPTRYFILIPAIVIDLLCLASWASTLKRLAKIIRFGASRVLYSAFPYSVQSTSISLVWQAPDTSFKATAGFFTLRCICEAQRRLSKSKSQTKAVRMLQWQGSYTFDQEKHFSPSQTLLLDFKIPYNLPPTHFRTSDPCYWELAVNLQRTGLDLQEVYLIPVYS